MKPSEWVEAKASADLKAQLTASNLAKMARLLGYPLDASEALTAMFEDPEALTEITNSPGFKQALAQAEINVKVVALCELLDQLFPNVADFEPSTDAASPKG